MYMREKKRKLFGEILPFDKLASDITQSDVGSSPGNVSDRRKFYSVSTLVLEGLSYMDISC